MEEVKKIYKNIDYKMRKSDRIWLILNIISFMIASISIVLNINMIRFNPFREGSYNGNNNDFLRMIIFIALSSLVALSTVIMQIISFFIFKKRANDYKSKKNNIKQEQKNFKNKIGDYANLSQKEREKLLTENIFNIIKR